MNNKNDGIKIGIACYRKEQWKLFKATADDPDDLGDKYEDWLHGVKQLEIHLILNGYNTERVDIDVNDLIQWCKKNNKVNTRETRSEYVAILLKN